MADLRIDIASEFVGAKAFKQADTATSALTKQVNRLAKTYLSVYGAEKLLRYGGEAVKAFAEDDKAARVLGKTLQNLGLGFGENAMAVNNYISGLEKQTGVLDDELRPAMDRLLRATGDVTKSQELLSLALDISAGTGKSVAQVSQSLQKAYLGQNAALGRLGVGLSKTELASSSFEDIQKRLSILFEGQATQAADTYSGSLDKLTVASNNAKEAIGRGLVDALSVLNGGGQGGFEKLIRQIDTAAASLETFIRRFGVGIAQGKALLAGNFGEFAAIGQAEANRGKGGSGLTPAIAAELKKAAAEKAALKRSKEQSALLAKNTKAVKEQTALQKAGTLFDVEQTGIVAALKGNISADERKRLELQLAILTGNTNEASKLAGQLAYSQGLTKELVAFLKNLPDAKNPFSAWASYLDAIEAQVRRIAPAAAAPSIPSASMGATNGMFDPIDFLPATPGGQLGAGFNTPAATVVVNVAGSVVSEGELVDAVRNGLINSSLSGSGSLVARRTGTFATL
jgi:hypothetical protein